MSNGRKRFGNRGRRVSRLGRRIGVPGRLCPTPPSSDSWGKSIPARATVDYKFCNATKDVAPGWCAGVLLKCRLDDLSNRADPARRLRAEFVGKKPASTVCFPAHTQAEHGVDARVKIPLKGEVIGHDKHSQTRSSSLRQVAAANRRALRIFTGSRPAFSAVGSNPPGRPVPPGQIRNALRIFNSPASPPESAAFGSTSALCPTRPAPPGKCPRRSGVHAGPGRTVWLLEPPPY